MCRIAAPSNPVMRSTASSLTPTTRTKEPGGNIPIEQWRADPSIGPHALMRTVLPVAAMPFDWSVQAADALANLNRKITGGEPVTPTPLPSTMLKNALGVPPAPEQGLQKYAETGSSLLLGGITGSRCCRT